MQSPVVMLALFMLALCVINSFAAAIPEDQVDGEVADEKSEYDSGKETSPALGSFNILEFFEQIKTKTDIAKIFGGLFVKSKE